MKNAEKYKSKLVKNVIQCEGYASNESKKQAVEQFDTQF